MSDRQYDVFISGAGPVGLVLAYYLDRLGHSVYIIDAVDKSSPSHPMYGRAAMLYSRTLEILDQLDLYDELAQVGFATDRTWGYKDGEPIDRQWGFFDAPESQMHTTFLNNVLNIRLKYSEDIFRKRLAERGIPVHAPVRLVDYQIDQAASDGYKVTATCKVGDESEETFNVRSRYIIGCDGAGSAVRRLAGIPFMGERKLEYWVRIDGIVKTNLPEARHGLGALESSTHGHVLWLALDHGATRIGYVLNDELVQKYGRKMTAAEAVHEAQRAVAPFELEFVQVDWHTVYGIQQHVAERFEDQDCVLLAGDAAHTHSSGSAQGMNTGIQDVANLAWRLAGTLKGWYQPDILHGYARERRAVALQLIDNDKTVSALVSQRKPDHLKHRPEHAHVLLDEFLRTNSGFSTGLGISYGPEKLDDNSPADSSLSLLPPSSPAAAAVRPGQRVPDALLQKPGIATPKVRFYDVTKSNGKFRIVVFTGGAGLVSNVVRILREQVDMHMPVTAHAADFITIVPGRGHAFDEHLGVRRFGTAYWDPDLSAHGRLGVSSSEGAILVVRPDGVLGFSSALGNFDGVMRYLRRILVLKDADNCT